MVFTNSLSSYYEKFLATGEVKCIDEEIPFEIPKGWEWSKLSNVIELLSGQDFIPEKYNSSNQGIPYITGASNIVNGNLVINRWTETPTVIGKLGDLLIVCKGSGVGKMCICNVDKIHIARQIQIIRNFSNAISLSYVKSVVEANLQTIISNAQGVIPGISREHILNLLIPLPPTNEQYEIDKKLQEILPVIDRYAKSQETLDKLNVELLGNLKKSILQEAVQGRLVQQIAEEGTGEELLEQIKLEKQQLIKEGKLKKSTLTDSVIFRGDDNKYYEQIGANCNDITDEIPFDLPYNWCWCRFSNIVSMTIGKTPARGEQNYWINGKYNWVSISDMVDGGTISTTKEKVSDLAVKEIFSVPISEKGSLLMSFKLSIGKTSILDINAYHNEAIITIRPVIDKEYAIRNYLFKVLPLIANLGESKDAIKGKTLNSKSLANLLIPLPPLQEQQRIIERINLLSKQLQ